MYDLMNEKPETKTPREDEKPLNVKSKYEGT